MVKFIAKFIMRLSKLTGRGGTSIGGSVAHTLDKNILRKLSEGVDTIIVITGTNGKTTTSNLIATTFEEDIIHNGKGANMYNGIISAFLQKKAKVAVLEVDEGSIAKVFADIKVDYFVVTNFFRDQLDRYAEIDMLVDKIKASISKDTHLILNANDPFTMRLDHGNSTYYGLDKSIDDFRDYEITESRYCPKCNKKLEYDKLFYLQIGYYNCDCGFVHPKLDISVSEIGSDYIVINNQKLSHNLKGAYNAYNLAAAYTASKHLNTNVEKGFKNYYSNDGRMQVLNINDNNHVVTLAKNPSGMNMSLSSITTDYKNVIFVLNDGIVDGIDISWIWDADFELLTNDYNYYICGTRKEDMAVRLKFAGIEQTNIVIVEDLDNVLDDVVKHPTFAISSYTGIEKVRKMFEKRVK